MLTLDDRIINILKGLAREPTKYDMIPTGELDNLVEGDEVCVFCRAERKYKHGTSSINHAADCIVREAKAVLHDHGL